jgi:hypothetical protein
MAAFLHGGHISSCFVGVAEVLDEKFRLCTLDEKLDDGNV